jgi:hypothetical protein
VECFAAFCLASDLCKHIDNDEPWVFCLIDPLLQWLQATLIQWFGCKFSHFDLQARSWAMQKTPGAFPQDSKRVEFADQLLVGVVTLTEYGPIYMIYQRPKPLKFHAAKLVYFRKP